MPKLYYLDRGMFPIHNLGVLGELRE